MTERETRKELPALPPARRNTNSVSFRFLLCIPKQRVLFHEGRLGRRRPTSRHLVEARAELLGNKCLQLKQWMVVPDGQSSLYSPCRVVVSSQCPMPSPRL